MSDQTGSSGSSRTFFLDETTADLYSSLSSFVSFAKWCQAGEEEAGLLSEVAGVSPCCLRKLPSVASHKHWA